MPIATQSATPERTGPAATSSLQLGWLPLPPLDFREAVQASLRLTAPSERLERLGRLAGHRLGFLETLQLDRALRQASAGAAAVWPTVRLALLAGSTVDHLLPAIRVAGLRRRLLIDAYVGGYGRYRQELLDDGGRLHDFPPDVLLLATSVRETLAAVPVMAADADVGAAVRALVYQTRALWQRAREVFGCTVIHQTALDFTDPVFGSLDRHLPGAPKRLLGRVNEELSAAAASDGVLLLDVAGASERDGVNVWFDRARWFQAKQEIAPLAAPLYGELLLRVIGAARGLSKKCLVLDLDNTLWHGVVGDDGVGGIVLGEGSAVGEAHLALHRYARQLRDRGVILAVCSKNEPAVADEAFRSHPEMLLKRSDFAAFVANWTDKADNLRDIARQLNIGVDSLVFVDDNPVERERVRQALPAVAVPELPDDVTDYVQCIASAGYFESVGVTQEDRQRGAQYQANSAREALRSSSDWLDDFLRDLQMTMQWDRFRSVDLGRVTQLINKTNQFNPTTRRYTAEQVSRFASSTDSLALQFRLADRFGDQGLVSAIILVPDPERTAVLAIDTWVMSCRVFGRQLEVEVMNVVTDAASRMGALAIRATYIPTEKNRPVAGLFEALGFSSKAPAASTNGTTEWELPLDQYVTGQTHIARSGGSS